MEKKVCKKRVLYRNSFCFHKAGMKAVILKMLGMVLIFTGLAAFGQDPVPQLEWKVTSQKFGDGQYQLLFRTVGAKDWQLYAPNQVLGEVATTEIQLPDSSISVMSVSDSGNGRKLYIESYGCQMNFSDSEIVASHRSRRER